MPSQHCRLPLCTTVAFPNTFSGSGKVQVHVSMSHGEEFSRVHSPSAVWVQSVSTRGFENFGGKPSVFVSAKYTRNTKPDDAMYLWLENVNSESFEVCIPEFLAFNGKHQDTIVERRLFPITELQQLKTTMASVNLCTLHEDITRHHQFLYQPITAQQQVETRHQYITVSRHVSSNEDNVYLQHQHNGAKAWMGLNDRFVEGNFTWADRGEGNFTAWAQNQPNSFRGEDCVHTLGVQHSYQWNDVRCSDCHQYTCKKDLNECERQTYECHQHASCTNELGSYSCTCNHGYVGDGLECNYTTSCSSIRRSGGDKSRNYVIDPDGAGGLAPFSVYCDMGDKSGVGVTVELASLSQLASLTRVSSHCEQFIKYECYESIILGHRGFAWWMSRDSSKMTYWGGASPGSGNCACGMTNSCADPNYGCNCDKNDPVWREDSGLLTDKTTSTS
ncbi:hypothetical protein ACROYT_G012158 [Oculina patagonica]